MKSLIFGSHAIKHWYPDFKREPSDLDIMTQEPRRPDGQRVEHLWADSFQEILDTNRDPKYVDPEKILTVKASHANWDIKWEKTICDILFLKEKGLEIDYDLYKKLKNDWRVIHGRESAPLRNKTADEFFADKVSRKYVHDDIHKAVAYYDKPLFLKILKSPNSVECSKKKFDKLSFSDKIKLAREEIYVTALERWVIPSDFQESAGRAYNRSLKKFVTTMSSGWMSFFLIDNFKFLIKPDVDYVAKFRQNEANCRLL